MTHPLRRAAWCVLGWVAAACLSGCAALRGSEPSEPKAAGDSPPPAAAPAAATPPADAASAPTVSYRVAVDAPGDLAKLLVTYLDLARFQNAPQTDGITNAELVRLAAASPAQARQLLETEGYFNAQVTVTRDDPPGETPLIRLKVDPGPRVTIAKFELTAEGNLQERVDAGEGPARELLDRLRKRWPLQPGEPFSQSTWNSAKNSTLAVLRAEGYPTASWTATYAHVDAKTREVELEVLANSGPLFYLGDLRIEGLKRYDEGAIRNVADFGPGTPYTEKRLLDFQERLGKLGLFNSVTVEIDPDPEKAAAVPVLVKVTEQQLQAAIAGVGYSDSTRERFTLEHTHRRPFGFNLQAHNKLVIGRYQRSWDGELLSDPGESQYRRFISGNVARVDTDDDTTLSWQARVGRTLDTERIQRQIYGQLLSATVQNALGKHTSRALSAHYDWLWRDVDDLILPTRGLTSSIQGAGGLARSTDAANGPFARVYTRNTLYWPLGNSWYSQIRAEFGEVFAKPAVGIPDPLLFRAGGDDSVRGYGYRDLGPRVVSPTTGLEVLVSGRKMLTASAEIAHPFSSKLPSVWWATFVDAGNAANEWDDFHWALGYGVGVRWRSPVGPLRIDLAYGQQVKSARLHFSVGISF
jgi:translocation and assembly module TamA